MPRTPETFRLIFTYDDGRDDRPDDILSVYPTDNKNKFRVEYRPGDYETKKNVTTMTYYELQRHIRNILNSLRYDVDPFERVQLMLPTAPSVFYHVSSLDDAEVRDLIYDMLEDAMDSDVEQVAH